MRTDLQRVGAADLAIEAIREDGFALQIIHGEQGRPVRRALVQLIVILIRRVVVVVLVLDEDVLGVVRGEWEG